MLFVPWPQTRTCSQIAERKIEITLTNKAHELLLREGYDPQFGARPLRRAIQRLIQDPLAMKLLDGEVAPGDSLTIDADAKKGVMTFERATVKTARKPLEHRKSKLS